MVACSFSVLDSNSDRTEVDKLAQASWRVEPKSGCEYAAEGTLESDHLT